MRCKLLIAAIAIFSFTGLSSYVFAEDKPLCARTIYNNSDRDWEIEYKAEHGSMYISADCRYKNPYDNEHDPMNFDGTKICVIKKKSSVKVEYSGMFSRVPVFANGHMYIIDQDQQSKKFRYSLQSPVGPCVHIAHKGNTGSVTLNNPAEGDIVIEKNYW